MVIMTTLQNVSSVEARAQEAYWINHYLQIGVTLYNNAIPNRRSEKERARIVAKRVHTNATDESVETRARAIIHLLANGYVKPDIMRHLWGVSPSKSAAYEIANEEFIDAMKLVGQMIAVEQESEAS